MSTPNEDKPSAGHCIAAARAVLPQFDWAINELSFKISLDELPVELEIITGQPAIVTRSALLSWVVRYVSSFSVASSVHWLQDLCPRLAVWATLAMSDGPNTSLEPALLSEMRSRLDAWCRGRERIGTYALDSYQRLEEGSFTTNIASVLSEIAFSARAAERDPFEERREIIRDNLTNAIGIMMPEDEVPYAVFKSDIKILRDRMEAAIINFPVNERAR